MVSPDTLQVVEELAHTWPEVVSQLLKLVAYIVPAIAIWLVPRPQEMMRMTRALKQKEQGK